MKEVVLQLESGGGGGAVAVAPDDRWGVWEVLYGQRMYSASGENSVGDIELSLSLAIVRALLRCPIDVRGDRVACLSMKDKVECKPYVTPYRHEFPLYLLSSYAVGGGMQLACQVITTHH